MLLGFDALGRDALGQTWRSGAITYTLAADPAAFTITGYPVTFNITAAAASGALTLGGVNTPFTVTEAVSPGAFSISGKALSFTITEAISAGSLSIGGNPVNEIVLETEQPGSLVITGNDVRLERTGFDYEFQQGGIGHLLLEAEEARRLAAITRKAPPPIDLRSPIRFPPLASPPVAAPAPVVDMAAVQEQRMAGEMRAAEQAKKRRRDVEAILLLAC
jgi:hypothetical protein